MPDVWTLKVAGVTKSFPSWGLLAPLRMEFVNKAKSSVVLQTTEDFDDAGQFDYNDAVVMVRNGVKVFQGFVGRINRQATGSRRVIGYTFFDWWWLAERLVFKQPKTEFNGWTGGVVGSVPLKKTVFSSEVYIGEKLDGTGVHYQTNGAQIADVVAWLNECYNPTRRGAVGGIDATQDVLQVGAIDPAANIPKSMVRSPFCSDMLVNLSRWSPDCIFATDHSTTPPTLNVVSEGNLVNVDIDISIEQARAVSLSPKHDRVLRGVLIYFKTSEEIDGVNWPVTVIQLYPDGTGGDGPAITEYTPDVATYTVDLTGGLVGARTTLLALPFAGPVFGGTADAKKDWLLARDTTLQDESIDEDTIEVKSFKVYGEDGIELADLSVTPNELLHTPAADFTGVATRHVTVKALVQYSKYSAESPNAKTHKGPREFNRTITLTDALSTTYGDFDLGEAVPAGLAKSIWLSVKNLKHEGEIPFVGTQARSDIALGKTLTLLTAEHEFDRLPVQSVVIEPHTGAVTARFGPSAVLDANDLVEMIRASRLAQFLVPSGRSDVSGGGTLI